MQICELQNYKKKQQTVLNAIQIVVWSVTGKSYSYSMKGDCYSFAKSLRCYNQWKINVHYRNIIDQL